MLDMKSAVGALRFTLAGCGLLRYLEEPSPLHVHGVAVRSP